MNAALPPRLTLVAAALAALALLPTSSAHAFNCQIPGIFSAAKKTVCGNATLAALDASEVSRHAALRNSLGLEAMVSVNRDRRSFLSTRDRCARDVRCHEATYTAQTRLYRKLAACADRGKQMMFCVNRSISKHREELHRSM